MAQRSSPLLRPDPAGVVIPQRCVLVLPSTVDFDSRTYRIASSLVRRGHVVTVLGRWAPGLALDELHPAGYRIVRVPVSAVDGLPLPARLRAMVQGARREGSRSAAGARPSAGRPRGRIRRGWAAIVRLLAIGLTVRAQLEATRRLDPGADLYHAMAYMGIPVALGLATKPRVPVVYDARDIYVDAANLARLPGPARRLFARIERRWARRARRVITVNQPYADVMAERFGVTMPLVVMNCAYRREIPAMRPRRFHEQLSLAPSTPVILYQGGFSRDRGIEELIAALPSIPGAALVLLGYGALLEEVTARTSDPALEGRLHVLPAVDPSELLEWVASADVVAMPIQPSSLNHRLTTPNKLFEAMAAGVPVVASDLPGMAAIVREVDCGILVDPTDPREIAAAVRGLLALPAPDRESIGRRGHDAHLERYNWEAQAELLFAEYGRLTGKPW